MILHDILHFTSCPGGKQEINYYYCDTFRLANITYCMAMFLVEGLGPSSLQAIS